MADRGEGDQSRPLSASQIVPVLQRGQPAIQLCYHQAPPRDFLRDVTLRLTIEIDMDGTVSRASVDSSDEIPPELEICVLERVRAWRFPTATAASRIVVPFAFPSR